MEPDKQAQFMQVVDAVNKLTVILDSLEHSRISTPLLEEGELDVIEGVGKILTAIELERNENIGR